MQEAGCSTNMVKLCSLLALASRNRAFSLGHPIIESPFTRIQDLKMREKERNGTHRARSLPDLVCITYGGGRVDRNAELEGIDYEGRDRVVGPGEPLQESK
jgi:hypothetical protein